MSRNKFETLIEYIINDDQEKAKELFHKIVIEKSRDIYESLEDDETPVEAGQDIESFEDEIEGDEFGDIDDAGIEDEDASEVDYTADDTDAAEGDDGLEDRVMDLEDAIDELKAEFDALMAEEEAEHAEDAADAEGEEVDDEVADEDEVEVDDETEEDDKDVKESRLMRKTPNELMREYVEKVSAPKSAEGSEVNTKSTVSSKNDMGGTSSNIARGGAEQVPTGPKGPSNAYAKGEKKMGQDKFENSPGANTKGYASKTAAKTKEESSVNDESVVAESRKARKPRIKG